MGTYENFCSEPQSWIPYDSKTPMVTLVGVLSLAFSLTLFGIWGASVSEQLRIKLVKSRFQVAKDETEAYWNFSLEAQAYSWGV